MYTGKEKALLAIAALLLLPVISHAAPNIFYSADVSAKLENDSLGPGDALKGEFSVANFEPTALNDAAIVAEIVSGPSSNLGYPSQFDDNGVIIAEQKFDARILAYGQAKIPFEIRLPESLSPGKYTLDVYMRNGRAPVIGIAHLFASPVSYEFSVAGSGNAPHASILRMKTVFGGTLGPVGAPVKPGQNIAGTVYVKNLTNSSLSGLRALARLCDWDDTACPKTLAEDSKQIDIGPRSELPVELTLKAPELPGAYAIRIELQDSEGNLISLYRNRAIAEGGTAKIRKLDISAQPLAAGSEAHVLLLLGPSPDHYTNPDFTDFDVKVRVEANGKKIFEKGEHIAKMTTKENLAEMDFRFTPESDYSTFKVCSSVEKQGVQHDLYCFNVSPLDYQPIADPEGRIDVEASYDKASGSILIKVCGLAADNSPAELNAHLSLVKKGAQESLRDSAIGGQACFNDSIAAPPSIYELAIDDFTNKTQFFKAYDFTSPQDTIPSCAQKNGLVCSQGQECSGSPISGVQEPSCCQGQCIETQVSVIPAPPTGRDSGNRDLQAWLILIIGIAAIFLVLFALKVRHDEKPGENYGNP